MNNIEKLGVDIGGVIIENHNVSADTSFMSKNFLSTPATADAFIELKRLNEGRFKDRVFLVSKCGPSVQSKTRKWLKHNNFYEITGISEDKVHFCLERIEKAEISHSLGLTAFVDDRLEILGYLKHLSDLFLFKPQEAEVEENREHLPLVTVVNSWAELGTLLNR
ncbi:MAG: hypothetical protein K2Y39_03345 [Candidatus Obscuribacterales bacterium]|nr:hypothetical protein [Candidatus Obscuribacterales bacterium]